MATARKTQAVEVISFFELINRLNEEDVKYRVEPPTHQTGPSVYGSSVNGKSWKLIWNGGRDADGRGIIKTSGCIYGDESAWRCEDAQENHDHTWYCNKDGVDKVVDRIKKISDPNSSESALDLVLDRIRNNASEDENVDNILDRICNAWNKPTAPGISKVVVHKRST